MGFMKAEVYHPSSCLLGEGPIWDHRSQELSWVDIDKHSLFFYKENEIKEVHSFEQKIGFALPSNDHNYIVGLEDGLYKYNRVTRNIKNLHRPELEKSGNRWNDAKCNPDGSIWGGTMSQSQELHQGALYQLSSDGVLRKVMSKVSISNGLAWHPDLEKMYYIDSANRSIQVFDYKPGSEVIVKVSEIETDRSLGYPDGMCIDEDGMLWVAHWDGYCVARYHPETGQLITKIDIPAPRVTSCCFGGKDLSRLFITTASVRLDQETMKKYPLSGSVFVIDTNTKGLETTIYGS